MDFDKTAREIADSACGNEWSPCPDLVPRIAAALKAAYNEGLEDAAHLAANVHEHSASHTHERAYAERLCPRIAASVRSKKVP